MCFREAASDATFWAREVGEKVLQFCSAQRTRAQLLQPGCGALLFAGTGPKRDRSPDRPDLGGDGPAGPKRKPKQPKKRRGAQLDGAPAGAARRPGGGGDGPPGQPEKSKDGRYVRSEGRQICWSWNRKRGGCSEPCPNKRLHVCEHCLGKHRGHDHTATDDVQ